MQRYFRAILYIILIVALPAGIFVLLPATVRYTITEIYTFTTEQPDTQLYLKVMLPRDNAYQDVSVARISWQGDSVTETNGEVDIVTLTSSRDDPGTQQAVLRFDVTLKQGIIRWHSPVIAQDTLPQVDIESDDPAMVDAARQLCHVKPIDTAYNSYHFTAQHIEWPKGDRGGEGNSALKAYQSGIGVCADFASLMTALSRTCDNPARAVSGLSMPLFMVPYTTKSSTWNHPGGAHAWVEVYDKGEWVFTDPSWASNMPFDRLWFGRSLGQYLSYGEVAAQDAIYQQMRAWAEDHGDLAGAMSAPLKFAAASSDGDSTTLTPVAQVCKASDMRWMLAVGSYFVTLVGISIVERRIGKC